MDDKQKEKHIKIVTVFQQMVEEEGLNKEETLLMITNLLVAAAFAGAPFGSEGLVLTQILKVISESSEIVMKKNIDDFAERVKNAEKKTDMA